MFLQSVLQVTATDSPTTIMSCLNAFSTAYTYHLHYFHIADANTLPHMDQRSPQFVPQIIHYQQTAVLTHTPTEHRHTFTASSKQTALCPQNLESPGSIFWRENAVHDPMEF